MLRAGSQTRATPLRHGFTLIEAAIVIVVIGMSIMGVLQLLAAGTMANGDSAEMTTSLGLASSIHEMSLGVAYDDIMSLDNDTYTPPVDARGVAISTLSNWNQSIDVKYVNPANLKFAVPDTQEEPTARITVTISHNGRYVYSTNWLATAMQWP